MAKRKNAVKSGLNQLRQALLQAKTAILNFSPEHILAVSYDPSSKATIVKDIPANLESQFTLGEGGGGGSLSNPKLTINVTVQGTITPSNPPALVNGNIAISTANNYYSFFKNNEIIMYENSPEDAKVYFSDDERNKTVTCYAVGINGIYDWFVIHTFLFEFQNATFSNMVNCSQVSYHIQITDPSKDASFDMLVEL